MTRDPTDDTSPDVVDSMTALYVKMAPEQKLQRVRELTHAANQFALAGLRMRHPGDTDAELRDRLARIRLGTLHDDASFDSDANGSG